MNCLLDSALTVFGDVCDSSCSGIPGAKERLGGEIIKLVQETLERSLALFLAVRFLNQVLWPSYRFRKLPNILIVRPFSA